MIDNCANQTLLTQANQLEFFQFNGLKLPIIRVRRNLFASFSRSCYYRLIEQADIISDKDVQIAQVTSAGINFNLGQF